MGRKALLDVNAKDYPYRMQRARHLRLKAAGICVVCGHVPARLNRNMCQACHDRHDEVQRFSRGRAILDGKCVRCRKPTRRASQLCRTCTALQVEHAKAKSHAANHAKPCRMCGKPRNVDVGPWCAPCDKKRPKGQVEQALAVIAKGLCQWCRKPRGKDGTKWYCRPCAKEHSIRTYQAYKLKRAGL